MSEANIITATALLIRHNEWLDAKGLPSSRYSRALSHLIADQVKQQQRDIMKSALLEAIYKRAIEKRDEVLSGSLDELTEGEQRARFEKFMKFQRIADEAAKAATNGQ